MLCESKITLLEGFLDGTGPHWNSGENPPRTFSMHGSSSSSDELHQWENQNEDLKQEEASVWIKWSRTKELFGWHLGSTCLACNSKLKTILVSISKQEKQFQSMSLEIELLSSRTAHRALAIIIAYSRRDLGDIDKVSTSSFWT